MLFGKKKIARIITGIMIGTLLLGGCERKTKGDSNIENSVGSEQHFFDLLQEPWVEAGELEQPTVNWSVIAYYEDLFVNDMVEGEKRNYGFNTAVDGSRIYAATVYYEETPEKTISHDVLMWFDTDTLERGYQELDRTGTSFEESILLGFDCVKGEKIFFYQDMDEEGYTVHIYVASLSEDGTLTEKGDLISGIEALHMEPEQHFLMDGFFQWDSRGNVYYISNVWQELDVLSLDGEVLASGKDLEIGKANFSLVCKTKDGIPVFMATEFTNHTTTYLCFDGEKMRKLFSEEASYEPAIFINPYGERYAVRNGMQLVCRNLKDGKYETCYIGTMDNFNGIIAMVQNQRGEIFCIKEEDGGGYSANVFSPVGIEREVNLQFYSYYYATYNLQNAISEYQRKHPGVKINLTESTFEDRDNDWTKLSAELVKGEGPDVLVLPRNRMVELAQKGVLQNVNGVLEGDMESRIFSGILDYGRWNGDLYGLTFYGVPSAFLVSDEVWQKDTWTLQEILQVLKEKEQSGEPYAAICNDWDYSDGMTAYQSLYMLLYDLSDTPFLDLEKGTCDFDNEDFIYLLEFCKKYDVPNPNGVYITETERQGVYDSVKQGNLMLYRTGGDSFGGGIGGLAGTSEAWATLGEGYHLVGYPSASGKGYYYDACETVCVRKGTENQEVINDFLNILFAIENQRDDNTIRKDLLQDSIVVMDYDGRTYFHLPGTREYKILAEKKNGETYLQEYLDFCDHCSVREVELEDVRQIIDEEVGGFFEGNLSAKEAAGIIESRVNLYLSERQ